MPAASGYYEDLGVASGATALEIKAAYRAKMKQAHPDVTGNMDLSPKQVEARTAEAAAATEAYATLGKPDRRVDYDRVFAAQERKNEAARPPQSKKSRQGQGSQQSHGGNRSSGSQSTRFTTTAASSGSRFSQSADDRARYRRMAAGLADFRLSGEGVHADFLRNHFAVDSRGVAQAVMQPSQRDVQAWIERAATRLVVAKQSRRHMGGILAAREAQNWAAAFERTHDFFTHASSVRTDMHRDMHSLLARLPGDPAANQAQLMAAVIYETAARMGAAPSVQVFVVFAQNNAAHVRASSAQVNTHATTAGNTQAKDGAAKASTTTHAAPSRQPSQKMTATPRANASTGGTAAGNTYPAGPATGPTKPAGQHRLAAAGDSARTA